MAAGRNGVRGNLWEGAVSGLYRNSPAWVLATGTRESGMKTSRPARNVDEYIAGFPPDVQARLEKVRITIRTAAPGAEETISYRIPAFKLKGQYLVYFAGFKNHIGLYPVPTGDAKFKKDLSDYKSGKATARLPLDQPVPLALIRTIVKLRAKENQKRAASR